MKISLLCDSASVVKALALKNVGTFFAKDCLLTLVKSRLALGSPGCRSFVRLSPCQKWPNTKENGY